MLIEVNSETDFVARNDEFQKLVQQLAMQVAGMAPQVRDGRVDPGRESSMRSARAHGRRDRRLKKPENVRGQIVDGQLRKWYQSVVLYEQPFSDTDQNVGDLITDAIARIGENIRAPFARFSRHQLGEEL